MPARLHPPRTRPLPRELVIPLLAISASVLLPLAYSGTLPDPVAIHWGLDGRPDGSGPLALHVVLFASATMLLGALPLVGAGRAPRSAARQLVGLAHGGAVLMLVLHRSILEANRGAAVWTDAASLRLRDLAAMLLLAGIAGVVGWALAAGRPERPPFVRAVIPVQARDGEVVAWVGRQVNVVGRVVGWVAIAAAMTLPVVAPVSLQRLLGLVFVSIGLLVWVLTTISVAVGPAGLTVGFGPFGRPRLRVPLEEIVDVGVEEVVPMAYGGWGYRIIPGRRAVIIRAGEGLRVTRRGRSDLVVTVDDAARAAGVLAAHLAGPGAAGAPEPTVGA